MGRTRGFMRRIGVVLGSLLASSAAASAQEYFVGDARVVESNGTSLAVLSIQRTTSGVAGDVYWHTVLGSATVGSDYVAVASDFVHFDTFDLNKTISVTIVGDLVDEWTPVLKDEVFFVQLASVPGPGTIAKGRGTVTIVDDDRNTPPVQFLSVVSDGGSTYGRNRLQWRVPAGQPNPLQIKIRWNKGPTTCTFPVDGGDGIGGTMFTAGLPGNVQSYIHNIPAPPHELYCYSVFATYPAESPSATVKARSFDATAPNPVKWAYTNTAALSNVAPPTVGLDAIYTVDNDGVVHAMVRGDGGGVWPGPSPQWNPVSLGLPAHGRSPVVPVASIGNRLLVGTENGELHAIDGRVGAISWARAAFFGGTQLAGTGVQAPPAALLKPYGGTNDLVLVGSNSASNTFFALDPKNGNVLSSYADPMMGAVKGMAVVDYAANRAYFATTATSATLFAVDLGSPAPGLSLSGLGWNRKPLGAPANGSLVARGGRLYVGTADGYVHSLRIADGVLSSLDLGNGEVKSFMFPDRRNGLLYMSTANKVWAVRDDLQPAPPNLNVFWMIDDIPSPSQVLHRPGTDLLYVGGGDGKLYEINVADADPKATKKSVLLEAGVQIGAPSLDITHDHVVVGSVNGIVRAVKVPLP